MKQLVFGAGTKYLLSLGFVLVFGFAGAATGQVTLTIPGIETDANGRALVPIELVNGAVRPAALSFQISFTPQVTLVEVQPGPVLTAAQKQVHQESLGAGRVSFLLGGVNLNPMASGTLMTLVFEATPPSESPLQLYPQGQQASAAAPDAAQLGIFIQASQPPTLPGEVPAATAFALLLTALLFLALGTRRLGRARWLLVALATVGLASLCATPILAVGVAGDADGSGAVDGADLQRVIDEALGRIIGKSGDIDLSGAVDAVDYQILVRTLLGENIDADDDGIPDAAETRLGSNPNSTDSDNDGLPDSFEVDFGLDPANPADATQDRDGDGIWHRDEYYYGLDLDVPEPGIVILNEIRASNSGELLDQDSASSDWVELYNPTSSLINLAGWTLTDDPDSTDKWAFPPMNIGPHQYLVVFASGKDRAITGQRLHTNFSLDAAGEFTALYNDKGVSQPLSVYGPAFPPQDNQHSYGWYGPGHGRYYFDTPTPGAPNMLGSAYQGFVADTQFSVERGFFDAPFQLAIATDTPGAVIRYTTDSSEPDATNGLDYTGPIFITGTTCVRAMALKPGWAPTNVDTQTYVFPAQIPAQTRPEDYPEFFATNVPGDYEMDPEVVNDPAIGPNIEPGLLSLPTLSIVTGKDNLFDPQTGIYMNPEERGDAWERPASVEFMYPPDCASLSCMDLAGSKGFQTDCGIRIQGNITRRQARTVKHPIRLLFKGIYGPAKLNFPLFGPDATDEINTVVCRAGYGNSWLHHAAEQRGRAQYIRDEWARETQLEVSGAASHGIFVHLYLNGMYWGVYNAVERPDGAFGAAYFGGEQEDYDALNSAVPTDGDLVAWNALKNLAAQIAQDPSRYPEIHEYLDVDQFIDYMILCFYQQNQDWPRHNWYGIRKREPGAGYMFFSWDAERIFESVTSNRTNVGTTGNDANSPAGIFQNLRNSTDFRLRFADRVHRLFFNDGLLTIDKVVERWNRLSTEITPVLPCESARWGDYRRDNAFDPEPTADVYKYDPHWLAERDRLLNNYFPLRTDEMMRQFRNGGLYPGVDAPQFNINGVPQHGGPANAGDVFTMTVPEGEIYYTSDGSDVREPGGRHFTVLPEYQAKRVLVPSADIGDAWRTELAFDDSAWQGPEDTPRSLRFDLPDQFIDCGLVPGSAPEATFACWVQASSLHNANILDKFPSDASGQGWSVRVRGDGRVVFKIGSKNSQATLAKNNGYSPGVWVHIACTFANGTARIILDGVEAASMQNVVPGVAQLDALMKIGQADEVNTGEQFAGLIRDVRIHDVALNESDIQIIMAGNAAASSPVAHWLLDEIEGEIAHDISGNGYDGQLDGSPAWHPGTGAVGFDTAPDYLPFLSYDVTAEMEANTSAYIRIPFSVDTAELAGADTLTLHMRYDDGFIAYLNGAKIAEANAPANPAWDASATTGHPDASAVSYENFDITAFIPDLQQGQNLLSIQGVNSSLTSSDFLISAEITAGQNQFTPSAQRYTGPIVLDGSTHITARTLAGSSWSAVTEAIFAIGTVKQDLRVTELMYHPADTPTGLPGVEFIELQNVGAQPLNLNLAQFSTGISFTFPAMSLDPGAYVVLTDGVAAFQAEYGTSIPVLGPYAGKLDNAGEQLVIRDANGAVALDFTYKDAWYPVTDGDGFSLNAADPAASDPAIFSTQAGWLPGSLPGGTPGRADEGFLPAPGAIVINEVLAHSHAAASDWIELHNTSPDAVNVGGWFLSDSASELTKFEIPAGTVLPAGSFAVFDEAIHFGNAANPGTTTPFALSENGETVYLSSGLGGAVTGYREIESFGASPTGIAFGRHIKSTGAVNFVAMAANTPGAPNAAPLAGPAVISEIMYDPGFGLGADEYVVVTNISPATLDLFGVEGNTWKFTSGIEFAFPANYSLTEGQSVVIAADPAAFAARYGATPGLAVLGPYTGRLENGGEQVQLSMPGDVDAMGVRQYIRVDRVVYDNTAPWPGAQGDGNALDRIDNTLYGNDVANWQAAAPLSAFGN